jgi:hypothetical protein
MPYLTNAVENELKRLKAMADERILDDEEGRAAKGTRSPSVGYWGKEVYFGFGLKFGDFFSSCSP